MAVEAARSLTGTLPNHPPQGMQICSLTVIPGRLTLLSTLADNPALTRRSDPSCCQGRDLLRAQ